MDRSPTSQDLREELAFLREEVTRLRRGRSGPAPLPHREGPVGNEGWYQTIFEQADVGIVHCSLEGRLLRANRRFADFLGYSVAELEGRSAQHFTPSEDWPEELRAVGELLAGRLPRYNVDKRYIRKDGVLVWGSLTITPFINARGEMEMLLATIQDIHARKMAEEALAENLHRYQIIFNNSPLGIVRLDNEGTIVNCNHKFVELMGSSREELLGFTATRQINARMREAISRAVNGEATVYEDAYTSITGGRSAILRVVFNPVTPGKAPSEVIATFEDVTDRKMAEEVIAHRLISLTRPQTDTDTIAFADLFNIDDLQLLQDQFSAAFGVASLITLPDGTPITRPSNFTRLCRDLIRRSPAGSANCRCSDAYIGRQCTEGPLVQTCLSGGLWDAGAGISVAGRHLANWLIGQVRDDSQNEEAIRAYAREIGIDEDEAAAALAEVPAMSRERFSRIATLLFTLASRLSSSAFQNLQQARSITELKEAQQRLQTSENRLRFALQGANDGLWDADYSQGGEVFFSDRALEILGYRPTAETGNTLDWRSLVHPEDFARIWAKVVELFKKRSHDLRDEIRLQKDGGGWKWVLVRGKVVLWGDDGRAQRLTGTLTDIDHRRKIDETQMFLLASDRNHDHGDFFRSLAAFLGATLDMDLVAIDRLLEDGLRVQPLAVWHQGRTLDAPITPLSGTARAACLGQEVCLVPAEARHRFPEDRSLAELAAESWFGVTLWGAKRREIGLISLAGGKPLEETETAEAVLRLVAMRAAAELERAEAEAERERLQMQLLQAQKMESVGRLAGGVAHDFNNMLGVILGHVDMLEERFATDAHLAHDLSEIKTAAQRSVNLTRQLLAFARKQTVSPRPLDLNVTVSGLLNMLRRLIGEGIRLSWEPGDRLWAVRLDPSQVDQILANLTINARDAMAGVGALAIATANLSLSPEQCLPLVGLRPGEYVQLSVQDDGCGMDETTRSHIFEPFFTTKEVGRGTGLGLATIYGIVKQNEGYIDVASSPGGGTTFRIFFPRHRGEAMASSEQKTETATPGKETVLLVEDEPSILAISEKMLERLGYAVLTATTPGEAERLATTWEGKIDLLLTDVIMPEMNGRELAQRLARQRPNMATLFMSGYTADVIAHHGVLEPGVHFIQKPFSKLELSQKVRQALDAA